MVRPKMALNGVFQVGMLLILPAVAKHGAEDQVFLGRQG